MNTSPEYAAYLFAHMTQDDYGRLYYSVSLLLIHWPDHNTPYDEPIRALEDLEAAGKIRHYGVSNFAPAVMDVCQKVGHLAANQVGYHLHELDVGWAAEYLLA